MSGRCARALCGISFVLALAWSSTARADDCACAVAACQAIATSQHQSTKACAQAASKPAQCTAVAGALMNAMKSLGVTPPAACAANAGGGGGSASGSGAGSGSGSSSTPPQDHEPTPLPPDPTTPTPSSDGSLACIMERTGGARVMVTGGKASFAVKCSGAGNATPQIKWTAPVGSVAPSGSTATWTLPNALPNPAEAQLQAVVTAGKEKVTLTGTVHVVSRHLTLDYRGEVLNTCTPLSENKGTLNVGFDLVCNMSIELTVADDLGVSSSAPAKSCGAGQISGAQLCMPQMESSWEAVSGWSLDSASGSIDNVSGIMQLSVTGNRIGLVRVHFVGGKTNDVHPNALFSNSFSMSADDGSFRSFGSLTTTPHAGGTNAFTIKAH